MKEKLGKRIKELRIQRGLTQEQLAEMISIGERNLSKLECGKNFLSAETLEKLALALQVKIKDIFDFDHFENNEIRKEELIEAIKNDDVDINLLYKLYMTLRS